MLKALFCNLKEETPPYTHNLIKLASSCELHNLPQERIDFLNYMSAFYIEARYAEQLRQLNRSINSKKAREIFTRTEELLKWLKKVIQSSKK